MLSNNRLEVNFQSLPYELLFGILLYLNPADIHSVAWVNKFYFTLAMNNILWRYKVSQNFPKYFEELSGQNKSIQHSTNHINWHDEAHRAHNNNYSVGSGFFKNSDDNRNKILFPLVKNGDLESLKKTNLKLYELERHDSNGITLFEYAKEHQYVLDYIYTLAITYFLSHEADDLGRRLLHFAILCHQKIEVLEWLVIVEKHKVDVEDDFKQTLLHYAASEGREYLIPFLMAFKLNINARDSFGRTALWLAVKQDHTETFNILMSYKPDISAALNQHIGFCDFGTQAIHLTAGKNCKTIAESLLTHGADINSFTYGRQFTPLHFAAGNLTDGTEIIKFLLKKGADIDARDFNGMTPLSLAIFLGNKEIAKCLIAHKANPKLSLIQDCHKGALKAGFNALHIAAKQGHADIVEALLNTGLVGIDEVSTRGSTPLHFAVIFARIEVISTLIKRGANINCQDNNGVTPLIFAVGRGYTTVIQYLLAWRADTSIVLLHDCDENKRGEAALHTAVRKRNLSLVRMLLDNHANINALNAEGESALVVALGLREEEIAKLLIDRGAYFDKTSLQTKCLFFFSLSLKTSFNLFYHPVEPNKSDTTEALNNTLKAEEEPSLSSYSPSGK